ncbi:bifunctional hydroxymethylpyrimidine kinase/phosphomethylpyrimidine kinase [Allorhizobium sp. BGMRC 0089]|uniref:bifunctional hydroxymethylpyrimidine kinase/phosphomethylpyrimidine kinase n=1 Tax=Allorhizobium sonneratiae TaxID=2934936 RepID=UPI0020334F89|nr:bifunctional hydroxymethylpyrimidine kinase/phosphomethylpyrimidine kinase [Allorhizobium sonneratiae]MCM2291604.1 bifunctional hydroxymethylpyrimidine kinase/phosphomethylpyrimidine kinase [Allorhizobium sonneratiae]
MTETVSITARAAIANVLSVAGSDPSGGAGIQADLKSFAARHTYGMAAITALTVQNTQGVSAVRLIEPDLVRQQIEAVFADIRVDAVKIGMIGSAATAETVGGLLRRQTLPIVLDTVMVAKGGASLAGQQTVKALIEHIFPLAHVITPNLPEAAALLGVTEAVSRAAMEAQAKALLGFGVKAVLLKGGHLPDAEAPDLLLWEDNRLWLEGRRYPTANTHGTGCSLSSAIAAELAKGETLERAVRIAKTWISGAIAAADRLSVGHGHGPLHHFHGLWPELQR